MVESPSKTYGNIENNNTSVRGGYEIRMNSEHRSTHLHTAAIYNNGFRTTYFYFHEISKPHVTLVLIIEYVEDVWRQCNIDRKTKMNYKCLRSKHTNETTPGAPTRKSNSAHRKLCTEIAYLFFSSVEVYFFLSFHFTYFTISRSFLQLYIACVSFKYSSFFTRSLSLSHYLLFVSSGCMWICMV